MTSSHVVAIPRHAGFIHYPSRSADVKSNLHNCFVSSIIATKIELKSHFFGCILYILQLTGSENIVLNHSGIKWHAASKNLTGQKMLHTIHDFAEVKIANTKRQMLWKIKDSKRNILHS